MLPAVPIFAVPRRTVAVLSTLALLAAALVAGIAPAKAATPDRAAHLGVHRGDPAYNKAIEIYNGTGSPVDLAAGYYTCELYSNGLVPPSSQSLTLGDSLAAGDVFVVAQLDCQRERSSRSARPDQRLGAELERRRRDRPAQGRHRRVVDSIGQVGVDPGTEWGSGLASTADNTIRRKSTVLAGDTNPGDTFDPAAQWDGFAIDTFDGFGSHTIDPGGDPAPTVVSTTPGTNATGVPAGQNVSVTFSEPVDAAAGAFALACAVAGPQDVAVSGGPTTFTLDPTSDFSDNDRCTVTVESTLVTDQDTIDPLDAMAEDYTFSFHTDAHL